MLSTFGEIILIFLPISTLFYLIPREKRVEIGKVLSEGLLQEGLLLAEKNLLSYL